MNAAHPTTTNWRKRRSRLNIDNSLELKVVRFGTLEPMSGDDNGSGGEISSFVCRRRNESIARRRIKKQIVDVVKTRISGQIKRKMRIALELSRLQRRKLPSKIKCVSLYNTVLNRNIEGFQLLRHLKQI